MNVMDANCAVMEMEKNKKGVSSSWNGVRNGNLESDLCIGEETLE